jgi:hypothetical protein
MIKQVTVELRTATEENARSILNRTAETYADSRVFLGLAGREFRCSHGEGHILKEGSTETFVFGGDANVKSAVANDPASCTIADAYSYPTYIRFEPQPNRSDADEDDWCLERVQITVAGTEGSTIGLTGLEGPARLFLGSDGGHILHLQPRVGAAQADSIVAPYARAAAVVDSSGQLLQTKNVTSLTKSGTGHYYVTVADTIDTSTASLQVTAAVGARWGTDIHVRAFPGQKHVVEVIAVYNDASSDEPFHLTVL